MVPDQLLTTSSIRKRPHSAAIPRIGCSGWQYKHWRGVFYPADLPEARWLEYYAERFSTVEINNTFYRLPDASTFARWARRSPTGFVFSVKASRFLTHLKKLKDPEVPLDLLLTRARRLGRALGPVLYQLPPRWPFNRDRLRAFVRALPRDIQHVVEFRDPSWYNDEAFGMLSRKHVALCLHDMAGSASIDLSRDAPPRVIGGFVYCRFHGPARYSGRYPDHMIARCAAWLADLSAAGLPIYAYFNNDAGGHAPRDAVRLRKAIARHTSANL
jgi:uncharacterized protein YecE (DUF72 family)